MVIGRGRRNISEATRRVVREAVPRRASLGTGFIGIGAVVVLVLRSIYGLGWFMSYWASGIYPNPVPAAPRLGGARRRDRHARSSSPA